MVAQLIKARSQSEHTGNCSASYFEKESHGKTTNTCAIIERMREFMKRHESVFPSSGSNTHDGVLGCVHGLEKGAASHGIRRGRHMPRICTLSWLFAGLRMGVYGVGECERLGRERHACQNLSTHGSCRLDRRWINRHSQLRFSMRTTK